MPVSAVAPRTSIASTGGLLRESSRGPQVVSLQQSLRSAGFDPGPVDGAFGPKTRAAVVAFQRAHHLTADGVAGPQTLSALKAATAPAPTSHPVLKQGSRGPAVADLQRKLAAAGFNPGGVDGVFGANTKAAVQRFQAANHLTADGVVGPKTWGALDGGSFVPSPGPIGGVTPGTDAFRQQLLAVAQREVGNVEATNHNDGAVAKYPAFFGRSTEAYCADFVSWVSQHSGGSLNDPSCASIRNKLISSGDWKGRTNPQPGDLVLFDWNHDGHADHIGLVKSVNANGTLTTIEGNTAGPNGQEGVWEKTRSWDYVLGFGNPV